MVCRAAKDRYMFHSSTLALISIVNDKYFEDAIIEVETFFKELKNEPTKKITMLK